MTFAMFFLCLHFPPDVDIFAILRYLFFTKKSFNFAVDVPILNDILATCRFFMKENLQCFIFISMFSFFRWCFHFYVFIFPRMFLFLCFYFCVFIFPRMFPAGKQICQQLLVLNKSAFAERNFKQSSFKVISLYSWYTWYITYMWYIYPDISHMS